MWGPDAVPRRHRHHSRWHSHPDHQRTAFELHVQLCSTEKARPRSSPAFWAPRFSSPIDCAPDLGGRVEYDDYVQSGGEHLHVRYRRRLDHEVRQREVRQWQLPPLHEEHHRLGRLAWAQLQAPTECVALRTGARGYKMPALDEFLNPTAEQQVALFEAQQVQSVEGGVKGIVGPLGFTGERVLDQEEERHKSRGSDRSGDAAPRPGSSSPHPQNKAYGAEIEAVLTPVEGLQLLGSSTILKAELGTGAGADIGSRISGVPNLAQQMSRRPTPSLAPAFSSKPTGTGSTSVPWTSRPAPRCHPTTTSTSARAIPSRARGRPSISTC